MALKKKNKKKTVGYVYTMGNESVVEAIKEYDEGMAETRVAVETDILNKRRNGLLKGVRTKIFKVTFEELT